MNRPRNPHIVCLIALGGILTHGCQPQSRVSSPQTSAITLERFQQISEGMSTEQVTVILGEPQDGMVLSGDGKGTVFLGVDVTQCARWTDGESDSARQIEVGFAEGEVAAAVYRHGDVVVMKPDVAAGRLRLLTELVSPTAMRVVVDVGAREPCSLTLGIAATADQAAQIEGIETLTVQGTTSFTVSARMIDTPDPHRRSLQIGLECLNPKMTRVSEFAVDEDMGLAEALAFDLKSGVYEMGDPVVVGIITGQKGTKKSIILDVSQQTASSSP